MSNRLKPVLDKLNKYVFIITFFFYRFNDYAKNSGGHPQPPNKPRIPRLRRMSAAAFNFLSNNIAPKWLTDRLADGIGGGSGGERTDNPKHRLSLNDDHGYGHGYGSTYNGPTNRGNNGLLDRGGGAGIGYNPYGPATQRYDNRGHNYDHQSRGYSLDPGFGYGHNPGRPFGGTSNGAAPAATISSSAPEHQRHRRLSSPDPVLAHCANTIAVADFLMTLQRSLDNSSVTMQPSSFHYVDRLSARVARQEQRSPLFTLFQDRRPSSSADSWQYSSLASTVSSSTTATVPDRSQPPPSVPFLQHPVASINGTINAVSGCQQKLFTTMFLLNPSSIKTGVRKLLIFCAIFADLPML